MSCFPNLAVLVYFTEFLIFFLNPPSTDNDDDNDPIQKKRKAKQSTAEGRSHTVFLSVSAV